MLVKFCNGRISSLPFGSEDVIGNAIEEVNFSEEEVAEYRKEWEKNRFMMISPEDYISTHLRTREEKERQDMEAEARRDEFFEQEAREFNEAQEDPYPYGED